MVKFCKGYNITEVGVTLLYCISCCLIKHVISSSNTSLIAYRHRIKSFKIEAFNRTLLRK